MTNFDRNEQYEKILEHGISLNLIVYRDPEKHKYSVLCNEPDGTSRTADNYFAAGDAIESILWEKVEEEISK